jgi:hypothetical protein
VAHYELGEDMKGCSAGLYNAVTLLFLLLTLVVFLVVLGMIAKLIPVPDTLRPAAAIVPTFAITPTDTVTPIPTETVTPSLTPSLTITPSPLPPTSTPLPTETATDTPTATLTPTDTLTPSLTPTFTNTPRPTRTPTKTRTPRPPTRTPLPSPTGPTPTKVGDFPFKVQANTPQLTTNFANPALGCSYQGIAGQTFGMNNEPLTGIQVVISSALGFNQTTISGSNPAFGQAGWHVQVDTKPNNLVYTVELRSAQGVPVSDKVSIAFPNACDRNLAIINFILNRPM